MAKHNHILKLEHFQKTREAGDVDLLIGVDRQSMHPRPLIMFNQDIAICYVRQPVQSQEFLILTGPTQDIRNLDGQMESFIDSETSLVIQNSQHISIQDRIMHTSHCYLNQHDRMEPDYAGAEEFTGEAEDEFETQIQDHPEEASDSVINIDPSEEEDILPLIAHLTSSETILPSMENEDDSGSVTNNNEQSSNVTITNMGIEMDSEAITSDLGTASEVTLSNMENKNSGKIQKIPKKLKRKIQKIPKELKSFRAFKWFSNKDSPDVLPNRSESFPISNDNVVSPPTDQHFLTTRPPRTETP